MTTNRGKNNLLPTTEKDFAYWDKTRDIIDQLMDIAMNYRQSGHPGGSRSKNPMFLTLLLSGAMRWDLRNPGARFGDRFILGAGHVIPLVYATLAVFNEVFKIKAEQTGDKKTYYLPDDPKFVLSWRDLLNFRHRGGLSGHAEMEGKTLFLKFNTGPSGHGMLAAVGEAVALKRAGVGEVKVFLMEGEGGLTPGGTYEAMNSAWGLNLDNLNVLLDWNDYGIDNRPFSKILYGTPEDWFKPHGWNVVGTEKGEEWGPLMEAYAQLARPAKGVEGAPVALWARTRKGRGYLKYDNASHGSPHPMNCDAYWETKKEFADKYNVVFDGCDCPAPQDDETLRNQFQASLETVMSVLRSDQELVDYLADRLLKIAALVPQELEGYRLGDEKSPFEDKRLYDFRNYPADMYEKPGKKLANRAGLAKWGAWVNAFGKEHYHQPLFLVTSADLSDSTNISGFAKGYGDFEGYGWYERVGTDEGVLLPQGITEMVNSGVIAGLASVNLSRDPFKQFQGFWGACSTYGSFSYLKYGMFRLYSQLVQDCEWKVGKVLWVAGHSGPETAEDSRTHYGIFATGVTQLFPKGAVINIVPWDYNEVPVLLAAAFATDKPIVAIHLTRPAVEIPDREKLKIPSHFEAAKGAYVLRDYKPGLPKQGTVYLQGTSAVAGVVELLPQLDSMDLNLKLVCVASTELFDLQPQAYKDTVVSVGDRANSTFITTQGRKLMSDWSFNALADEYALSSDWDNRWRTGGSLDEVLDEARLTPEWILKGLERFAKDSEKRLSTLRKELEG